jgi:hypothetical protein
VADTAKAKGVVTEERLVHLHMSYAEMWRSHLQACSCGSVLHTVIFNASKLWTPMTGNELVYCVNGYIIR